MIQQIFNTVIFSASPYVYLQTAAFFNNADIFRKRLYYYPAEANNLKSNRLSCSLHVSILFYQIFSIPFLFLFYFHALNFSVLRI